MPSDALEMTGVSKIYEVGGVELVALESVDLNVGSDEVVTLLGPSGSGKTTLLSISGGLLSPTSGRIVVAGEDITRLSARRLTSFRRERVGFIFQAVNLVPFLTARENLLVVAELAKRKRGEAKRRAERLLEELGLGGRMSNLPSQLSGGERQRVAIGRALMNSPELVLIDEPTSALDSDLGQQVMELIVSEVKARGAAAIVVTHDARITRYGDRILNMADGRIVGAVERDEWTHHRPALMAAPAEPEAPALPMRMPATQRQAERQAAAAAQLGPNALPPAGPRRQVPGRAPAAPAAQSPFTPAAAGDEGLPGDRRVSDSPLDPELAGLGQPPVRHDEPGRDWTPASEGQIGRPAAQQDLPDTPMRRLAARRPPTPPDGARMPAARNDPAGGPAAPQGRPDLPRRSPAAQGQDTGDDAWMPAAPRQRPPASQARPIAMTTPMRMPDQEPAPTIWPRPASPPRPNMPSVGAPVVREPGPPSGPPPRRRPPASAFPEYGAPTQEPAPLLPERRPPPAPSRPPETGSQPLLPGLPGPPPNVPTGPTPRVPTSRGPAIPPLVPGLPPAGGRASRHDQPDSGRQPQYRHGGPLPEGSGGPPPREPAGPPSRQYPTVEGAPDWDRPAPPPAARRRGGPPPRGNPVGPGGPGRPSAGRRSEPPSREHPTTQGPPPQTQGPPPQAPPPPRPRPARRPDAIPPLVPGLPPAGGRASRHDEPRDHGESPERPSARLERLRQRPPEGPELRKAPSHRPSLPPPESLRRDQSDEGWPPELEWRPPTPPRGTPRAGAPDPDDDRLWPGNWWGEEGREGYDDV